MLITGSILAITAALLHVFIFYLESMAWTSERTRVVFGLTAKEADSTREMAFNQGFYNLFLAIEVVFGVVLLTAGASDRAGLALVLAGTVSMSGAAAVLWLTSPDKRGAALKQGAIPLLATVVLAVAAIM
jgi:putative membrane protein